MYGFWVHPWFWAPRSAQKRHLEALLDRFLPDPSADARTPQNGVLSALFAPRSLQEGQRDRETKHALHSHKAITFGMFDGSLVHRKWQGALRSHFHGVGGHRRRRCPWRFWRIPGAQNQGCTPKTYKMVGNILDTHLLATLTRAVYAKSPSQ